MEADEVTARPRFGTHVPQWAGTLSFLFTDAEGSTRLFDADPAQARRALDAAHDVVRSIVTHHDGWFAVEQGGGDSTVAVFRRSSAAASAAVAIQEALADQRLQVPTMRLRAAVVTGNVDQRPDGTYVGPTLNRCGRLLAAAHGDQVLTTSSTWELSTEDGDLGLAAIDLGEHRLRGIERPMHIVQLQRTGTSTAFPPLRGVLGTVVPLPRRPTNLFGRSDDVLRVIGLLHEHRVISIVGAGGVGKTRLAIEAGAAAAEQFDQVCWVDLSSARRREHMWSAVASGAGLPADIATGDGRIAGALAGRRDLLVLDNCEQVLEPVTELIRELVAATETTLLTTTREPIGAYGEAVFRAASLPLPEAAPEDPIAAVERTDSARLFVDRARLVRPELVIDAEAADAIISICRRLDGLPLAIELAAARLEVAQPREVADGLGDRIQLLTGSASGHLSRQRTLEASIAWSYDLLDDTNRGLLDHLSVFTGPFPPSAAAAVAESSGGAAGATLQRLGSLTRRSMLVAEPGPDGTTWYRFLETIRAFALERLIGSGDAEAVRRAHLQWVVEFCRRASEDFEGPDPLPRVEQCRHLLADLRTALDFALATDSIPEATAIVGSLGWFWVWDGLGSEMRDTFDVVREHLTRAEPADRLAFGFADVWTTAHASGDPAGMDLALQGWAATAEDLGNARHTAVALVIRGSHQCFSDPEGSRLVLQDAFERCGAVGESYWETYAECGLAFCWIMLERIDQARPLLDHMEARARRLGNPQLVADALSRRAVIDYTAGRYAEIEATCRELEGEFAQLTHVNVTAAPRSMLMSAEAVRGRGLVHEAAARELLGAYLRSGEIQHVPLIIGALADILIATDRAAGAEPMLAELAGLVEPYPYFRVRTRHRRALVAMALDDRATARELLDRTAEDTSAIGNLATGAETAILLAVLDRRDRRHRAAFDHAWAGASGAAVLGAEQTLAAALEVLAALLADTDRHQAAARLLGAAGAARARAAVTIRLGWQSDHEATLAMVRTALGDTFADETDTGRRMPIDDALALADRLRGSRDRPKVGWDALTATERQVAGLAASGRTNPQIATELVVGRETVKTHLTSIYRKLDISNRVELAALLAIRADVP
ncbi:MAG: hypothetical protein KA758_07390 [Acidimicrobiales bacterium]|jgi:predicted ATPase/class 3 adenylate cyclase/DNA-binding CsgD family transcriptional regulator|nr:hypothetical protein [Acidimicrobiales bacterium]